MTDTKTAVFIKYAEGMRGDARLYKLDPPIVEEDYEGTIDVYEYVIVSATTVDFSGPETYIFGANENGEVISWTELDGSFRGGLDHTQALDNAGYSISYPELAQ